MWLKKNSEHIRDLLRLTRVEDYSTFIQLIIGFVLAGGKAWADLVITLLILAPCLYGGLYALNDAHDAASDRLNPIKKTRPVAAGRFSAKFAYRLGAGLISVGLISAFIFDTKVVTMALIFLAINLTYTFGLKSVPYIEIIFNAMPHPIRFAAGLYLAGSWDHWPLLISWFPPILAIVILKRIKEIREAPVGARPVLRYYAESTLKRLIAVNIGIMLGWWPFTHNMDFVLTGVFLLIVLGVIYGYFYVPQLKRLEEALWR